MVLGIFAGAFFRQYLEVLGLECRAIVEQAPRGHVLGLAGPDRDDDVGKKRPRVIEIVLRRPRRMIRMRVVEAKQVDTELAGAPFGLTIVLRTHEESAARSFLGRVRQREGGGHDTVAPVQGAATFVRIRFGTVAANVVIDAGLHREPHQRAPPASSQKRSDRYFSPPSQNTTTITASVAMRATWSAPARLAPLEMPTNSPCRARRRVNSKASSVLTPMSSSASVGS